MASPRSTSDESAKSPKRDLDLVHHRPEDAVDDARLGPHEVRRLCALHPAALTALNRIFASEIARWQKATSDAEGGETGSVAFVQRFDSRLGCFVHLHVLALDGVFTERGDAVEFHPGRAPSWREIREVARRVGVRMTRWLRRRGFVGERAEDERAEQPAPSALEACMRAEGHVRSAGGRLARA